MVNFKCLFLFYYKIKFKKSFLYVKKDSKSKGEIRRSNLNPNVEGNFTFKVRATAYTLE